MSSLELDPSVAEPILIATLKDFRRLKCILEPLNDMMQSLNLCFSDTGMMFQAMDSSHVALAAGAFPVDAWDKYSCTRSVTLGLDLKQMMAIFRHAPVEYAMTLSCNSITGDMCNFLFVPKDACDANDGASGASDVQEYEVRCQDIDTEVMTIPDSSPDASWTSSDLTDFSRLIDGLIPFCDTARFVFDVDAADMMTVETVTLADAYVRVKRVLKATTTTIVETTTTCSVTLALRYLKTFSKGARMTNATFSWTYKEGLPVCVSYTAPGLESVRFYLAPKIED